ncbi:immunity 49 family protein [Streptomyces sp. NPDC008313]|uniref:immunity 49 family protein n=1 Tax=Streptomyces sp. NPDC008313 TaxID=3364826 RepID=UPI0036EE54DC
MRIHIARHGVAGPDDEGYAKRLADGTARSIGRLERSPRMFDITFDKTVMTVQARCAIDPKAIALETWEATVNAMQVGSAIFATAGVDQGTVPCRIDREVRFIPATGSQPYADAGNWLNAFWFAIVCRDQRRMTDLCAVPQSLLRESGHEYDEYIYHWIDTLQAYWLKRPNMVEAFTAAIQQSHPDIARIADRDLLNKILYQPINLFHKFVRKNEAGFNEALVEALEHHKTYWTETEDREESVEGLLALGPLAITCLAYDGGIPVEVESDYLPKHLVERTWVGEFEV